MAEPYFPDIMEGIVERVSAAFQARATDPFEVFFDKGIYAQTERNVIKNKDNFPLVWLRMPYTLTRSNWRIYGEAVCDLLIAIPTDWKYTQQERQDLSYKPRLNPIYDKIIYEIARERWFLFGTGERVSHKRVDTPFWDFGGPNGVNSGKGNLFSKDVDVIRINNLKLNIKRKNCEGPVYTINPANDYPASPYILSFYDDIELIVDGGESYDPVSGQSSVVIPQTIGKDFDIMVRGLGQMRKDRSPEFTIDDVNGGFSLTNGFTFNANNTYTIKFRPKHVSDVPTENGTLTQGVKSFFIETT